MNDQSCLLQRISENVKIFTPANGCTSYETKDTNESTNGDTNQKLRANTIESYLSKLTKPEETRKTCMQKKRRKERNQQKKQENVNWHNKSLGPRKDRSSLNTRTTRANKQKQTFKHTYRHSCKDGEDTPSVHRVLDRKGSNLHAKIWYNQGDFWDHITLSRPHAEEGVEDRILWSENHVTFLSKRPTTETLSRRGLKEWFKKGIQLHYRMHHHRSITTFFNVLILN